MLPPQCRIRLHLYPSQMEGCEILSWCLETRHRLNRGKTS